MMHKVLTAMRASFGKFLATVLSMALILAGATARADTPINLFQSFTGKINFVGTQKTKRQGTSCGVSGSVSATLAGIPATATILSAQLYWAGSGPSGARDYSVQMDGKNIAAPTSRRFSSTTRGGGLDYFSGAADVTAQVTAKRNGVYKFSNLSIKNNYPYCSYSYGTNVLGGFALLVVYSDPSEQIRTLNLHEGFQYINNTTVQVVANNFSIPNPVGSASGRVGYIAWMGDAGGTRDYAQIGGNYGIPPTGGTRLSDGMNVATNVFNSASNINNDANSYGIDFDAFPITAAMLTAGATSVPVYFGTTSDPVLFSAAIISLPMAYNDLAITKTRNTPTLVQGQNAVYTLTVSNSGPGMEAGPVVITDTLPAGMSYVSGSGTGWSCTNAGSVVTCTNNSTIASGAALPPLTLTAMVNASGSMTNTATVAGKLAENVTANNTASDTAVASAPATSGSYVFTDAACTTGVAFGAQTCRQLGAAALIAGTATQVFVTAVNTSGVPTQLNASSDTTVKLNFAIACINPATNAGVAATYVGVSLPLCSANGATPSQWSAAVDMVFKAGKPSAVANSFAYADVGLIQLFAKDPAGKTSSGAPFVVKPASLEITAVTRTSDGLANPATTTSAGAGFAKAGEALTIKVAAFTSGHVKAPNFGSEGETVLLTAQVASTAAADVKAAMVVAPLAGAFANVIGGEFVGTAFSLNDVGVFGLTPQLGDNSYLGFGLPGSTVGATVGRIYPDHFDTEVTAPLECLPHMNCPLDATGAEYAIDAVYSSEAFDVDVQAKSAGGAVLNNYSGALARQVTLAAFGSPGGAAANPGAGVLSNNLIQAASFVAGEATGSPTYSLPNPFTNSAPRALNWTMPTALYLRASAVEAVAGGTVTVTSLRGAASGEDGVMAVSGRLSLSSPYGSELARVPVRVEAQYWTAGGRWEPSDTDSDSAVQSGGIVFANCTKGLGPSCPPSTVLGVTANTLLTLSSGTATFWLRAPGAGRNGSAEFQMNNPAWLPSTIGRAVFGVFKSPLLYQRELY